MDKDARVQIYDIPTGTLSTIPAREISPDMVQVKVTGIEGECWVQPDQLQKSPYQHPPFDDDMRDYLHEIKAGLDEVYPLALEDWEDGFRRDTNVEQEIAIWLHISKVYTRLTDGKSLSLDEKQDIFHIILGCVNHPRDQVLAAAELKVLSRPEAEAIVAEFFASR